MTNQEFETKQNAIIATYHDAYSCRINSMVIAGFYRDFTQMVEIATDDAAQSGAADGQDLLDAFEARLEGIINQ